MLISGLINLGYQVTPPRDPYQYGLAIEFTITSDDGSQLILDNQIHIDNSGAGTVTLCCF